MFKKVMFISALLFCCSINPNFAQEGFLGEIRMFAGNFAPRGWAFCDGSLIAINSNQALFSILGTTYGGDGRTTFALPDLRGRTAIGTGTGNELSPRRLGVKGGMETELVTQNNLPSHGHMIPVIEIDPDEPNQQFQEGSNSAISAGNEGVKTRSTRFSGNNVPMNNMQPFLSVNYIICVQGTFPSRN